MRESHRLWVAGLLASEMGAPHAIASARTWSGSARRTMTSSSSTTAASSRSTASTLSFRRICRACRFPSSSVACSMLVVQDHASEAELSSATFAGSCFRSSLSLSPCPVRTGVPLIVYSRAVLACCCVSLSDIFIMGSSLVQFLSRLRTVCSALLAARNFCFLQFSHSFGAGTLVACALDLV